MELENDFPHNSQEGLKQLVALRKCINDVLSSLQTFNDGSIDQALLKIRAFYDVDRVYIGIFGDNQLMDFMHEVTRKGIISKREKLLRKLPLKDIPWWTKKISNSESIIISDVKSMPANASREQELLQMQDILSTLSISISLNDQVIGCLGIDSVREARNWSAFDLEHLRIFAEIIATSIEKERMLSQIDSTDKELLKSEAKFRMIFEQLPLGIELFDEKGTLLNVNDADTKIFGTKREEVIGLNIFDDPLMNEPLRQSLLKGEESDLLIDYDFNQIENANYYKSYIQEGIKHLRIKTIPLKDTHDQIFGFIIVISDKTNLFKQNEKLTYNLARLKAAVSTGNAFTWEYDIEKDIVQIDTLLNTEETDDKNIEYIKNHQVLNLKDYLDSIHPDYRAMMTHDLHNLIEGKADSYVVDYKQTLSGREFWFHSIINAFNYNSSGKPKKLVSYSTDITEQKTQQNELIRVKEADKMKSVFLASMSHEIRTPLNAIVGFTDIIAETDNEDECKQYLEIIHQNTKLLLHIIDDILDFSKIEAGTFKYQLCHTNIKDLCDELYVSNKIKMKPEVRLIYDKELPSIFIETDAQRVIQVIGNFINNATKFTEQGYIKIDYKQVKNEVKVAVSDTGIGIADNDKERIFQRFVKVNNFAQGTGLGLAISKMIITTLGGRIGVESKEGEGSTFWFTLPICKNS